MEVENSSDKSKRMKSIIIVVTSMFLPGLSVIPVL